MNGDQQSPKNMGERMRGGTVNGGKKKSIGVR